MISYISLHVCDNVIQQHKLIIRDSGYLVTRTITSIIDL